MKYKEIKCKYCGDTAFVSTLRKSDYCNKEECVKKAHNDTSKVSYDRKNASLTGEKKISTKALDEVDISDIKELFIELGNLEYKIISLSRKEKQTIDYFTKRNDMILHQIEFGDYTREQKNDLIDIIEKDRTARRGSKFRKKVIDTILDSITIKNPDKFLRVAYEKARDSRNLDETFNELKMNSELFRNTKGEEKFENTKERYGSARK